MPDLVIEVKPEPDARPLQAPELGPFSPKEVPAPGRFEGEPRHSPGPVPAGSPLHALGARNQWALWTPLIVNPRGERPLPLPRLPSPLPGRGGGRGDALLQAPTPGPRPCSISVDWFWPPAPTLTFGFSLSLGTPSPHPAPPHAYHPLPPSRPPALDRQTPRSVDLRPLPADLSVGGHHCFHGPQEGGLSAFQRPQPLPGLR